MTVYLPSKCLPLVLFIAGGVVGCSSSTAPSIVPTGPLSFSAILSGANVTSGTTLGRGLRVTIRNAAPDQGTLHSPIWLGLHDGTLDLFDSGTGASMALERLAEDGNLGPLVGEAEASGVVRYSEILEGVTAQTPGPIAPGESVSVLFRIDASTPEPLYLSYASMLLPSNDGFLGNDSGLTHPIYDGQGNFVANDFTVAASLVYDAGTEVNDEIPLNTAFFGQVQDNTGNPEFGTIAMHGGYLAVGNGGILDDPAFAEADFASIPGYEFLRFEFREETYQDSPAGLATVEVNDTWEQVSCEVLGVGLTSTVQRVELREGSSGEDGALIAILDLATEMFANGSYRASGTTAILPVQGQMLQAGEAYLQLVTDINPLGELRGQVDTLQRFGGVMDTKQPHITPSIGMNVQIVLQNRAPKLGTFLSPIWLGFHNASFNWFNEGGTALLRVERLAEDADTARLSNFLRTTMFGVGSRELAGAIWDGPIGPGESVSTTVRLNPMSALNQYLSYATMLLPSNDAFLSNDDPTAIALFDGSGEFLPSELSVMAPGAWDAGTELNDEVPMNTGFFGQIDPDMGVSETQPIANHPGYLPSGSGGILDDPMFAAADFANTEGYEFMRVIVREGPSPEEAGGRALLTLNEDGVSASFSMVAHNLSGPVMNMHIHQGGIGEVGTIEFNLTPLVLFQKDGALFASGTLNLSPSQVADLEAGQLYVNVHTELNLTGELRTQL